MHAYMQSDAKISGPLTFAAVSGTCVSATQGQGGGDARVSLAYLRHI